MNLSTASIVELKALAYEQILQRDNATQNLQIINAELQRRIDEENKEVPEQESEDKPAEEK